MDLAMEAQMKQSFACSNKLETLRISQHSFKVSRIRKKS
jgi:hypothetical protein